MLVVNARKGAEAKIGRTRLVCSENSQDEVVQHLRIVASARLACGFGHKVKFVGHKMKSVEHIMDSELGIKRIAAFAAMGGISESSR